jgi:hypothetical protein
VRAATLGATLRDVRRQRPTSRWPALAAAPLLAGLLALAPAPSTAGAAGGRLVPGSPVPVTDLTQVVMSSFATGLGVADVRASLLGARGRQFVVATTDGGASWRVVNAFVQHDGAVFGEPRLLVARDGDLYVLDTAGDGRVFVSTDGAASWQVVAVVGLVDSARVVGDALWVTADRCAPPVAGRTTCRSYLSTYALGATDPFAVHEVPGSTSRGASEPVALEPRAHEASVVAADGAQGAVVVDGGQFGPSGIVATADDGATWRRVDDPCDRPAPGRDHVAPYPVDVTVAPSGRWTLYCALDYGMNQGYNVLYASPNRGRGWWVLARAALPGVPPVGRFDAGMAATFAMSNDGSCFWKVSTVGPESQSCDGGRTWSAPRRDPNAEAAGALDPIGPRGAFLVDVTQGLWWTRDGVRWTLLR